MGLSFMLVPLLVIAVIVIIVVAGSKIDFREEGGEEMIKNVYIYLVLFATLMMTIGGSVAAFMAVADIYAPVAYHQSFEDFKRWGIERDTRDGGEAVLSEEEFRNRYDAMIKQEHERQVMRAKNNLIKSFGWIVIPFPIFLYFQRKLKTAS